MTWKRYLWLLLPLTVLLAGAMVSIFWPRIDLVTERFNRIQVGMSIEDVKKIMDQEPKIPFVWAETIKRMEPPSCYVFQAQDGRLISVDVDPQFGVYDYGDIRVQHKRLSFPPPWWKRMLEKIGLM